MSLAGQQIGAYRLLTLVKRGNKCEVYQATESSQSRPATVTILSLDATFRLDTKACKKAVLAFRQEATWMMQLDHPSLNPLLFYGEETQGDVTYLYLVTAATTDGTLDDYLQRSNDLLALEDVSRVIEQIASALHYIHTQGFVHGEIKPSYIAIKSSDKHHIYEVCLDGLAVTRCLAAVYSTSAIRGNPAYLAPEQWHAQTSAASDQYALAVLTYKLMTGHAPFHGSLEQLEQQHRHLQPQSASLLNSQLPRVVDTVLYRALAKDPRSRYPSVSLFSQDLLQAVTPGSPVGSRPANQNSPSRVQRSIANGLTVFKANLTLFLLFTGLSGVGVCIILNGFHLLPAPIFILGSSLGSFISFITGSWTVLEKLFPQEMWLKSWRWPIIIISLLTVVAILAIAAYLHASH